MEGSRRRGGFRRKLGTGEFVRNYLREHGPSRNYVIWQAYRDYCEKHGYSGIEYDNFRSYFWYLKKVGLVEVDHYEKCPRGGRYIYYRLNPEMLGDSSWKNPREFYKREKVRKRRGE